MEKKKSLILVVGMALIFWVVRPSMAIDINVEGTNPVRVMGYIQQGASYGIAGEHYDSEHGFNSFVTTALLELDYQARPDLKFFVSGNFSGDWAYPILNGYSKWDEKGYPESRGHLFILDNWQDILKEAHVTWAPEHFYIRAGKQIVSWGETDGFLVTNVINPLDQRRGLGDVRFESTIIPIWMLRTEYIPGFKSTWVQDVNFQFIFNPNFKFRGNENIQAGNDFGGAWAPGIGIPGPFPFGSAHLGSVLADIKAPRDFNPEGYEYGFRTKAVIADTIISLMGFYGKDRDYVSRSVAPFAVTEISPYDEHVVLHPVQEAYYPRFKFVGASLTKDLDWLKASFLGGVSPVLRLEGLYAFNSSFGNSLNTITKTDELRAVIGIDWKVKIPFLNQKAYFFISPQFYYQRLMDFPTERGITLTNRGSYVPGLFENNYKTTMIINTTYFHNKLQPMFFWYHDWTNHADFFKAQVAWEQSHHWIYALGAICLTGSKEGRGFQVVEHRDQVYATVTYRF